MAARVFVFIETKSGTLKKSAAEGAAVAARLANEAGGSAEALVCGTLETTAQETLAKFGISQLHHFESTALDAYNVHLFAPLLANFIKEQKPLVLVAAASLIGKDLMPRLAAMLGVGLASDCTAVEMQGGVLKVRRPVYAGKAFVDFSFVKNPPYLVSLRPNVFAKNRTPTSLTAHKVAVTLPTEVAGKLLEVQPGQSKRADLTEADIIVSGGRSLKSADNFKILFDLADTIGATVGASRAAVDAGYAPHSMQVGQTGKVVSPKLYIAFGISGAIQHLAGMRTSKVIVAINTDPEAPIFKRADYGIVGDLFALAPEIAKAFKKLLA